MVDFELIIKYFSGKATPEEAAQVEEFVQASPEHHAYFHSLFQSWQESAGEKYEEPDIQKEWDRISAQHLPVKQGRFKAMAIAASLVVLLGLAGYFAFLYPGKKQEMVAITAQQQQLVWLPDSTKVTLASGAHFQYPKPFHKNQRVVSLDGNADFEVRHNSNWPFIIHLPHDVNIRVTGTAFSVIKTPQNITVVVRKGSVLLYNPTDTLPIIAGQTGQYLSGKNEFQLLPQTGSFRFKDEPLNEVARQLSQYFKVQIHFQNPAIAHCRLSAGMEDKNIKQIIQVIAITFNLDYKIEGKNIYLDGAGCP
jgi:ferric-dicitrate binding protein FerR (iron transport regulator)